MTDTRTAQHTPGPWTYEPAVYSDDKEWAVVR